MKINIKGPIRDLLAFRSLVPNRRKRIAQAPAQPLGPAPMNKLAHSLHPARQHLIVADVRDETQTTRTFKLVPDPDAGTQTLAYFRAGQYLSLKVDVDGVRITRPYSIASAPYQALGSDGFYEITLRKKAGWIPDPTHLEELDRGHAHRKFRAVRAVLLRTAARRARHRGVGRRNRHHTLLLDGARDRPR